MKMKYAPPEPKRWALMEWTDIPSKLNPELVYLRRLRILQTPWWAVYLHWINEPDTDRDIHDHPWRFWSLILRGGYTEEIYERLAPIIAKRRWRQWSAHHMPITMAHRITSVEPKTVTLVITGRRVRDWCFWTEDGLIPWRQYLADNENRGDV
jgi:hypothetical protein